MTKIKICGLRRAEDVEFVNEALPDSVGFVFAKHRRRYIPPDEARMLRRILDKRILSVGVFVDESIDDIAAIVRGTSDIIQLHGHESEDYIRRVKALTRLPVAKAFSVSSEADIRAAESSCADIVLLDNGIGGTGESFNYELLSGIERAYILAGGITPENAAEIVKKYAPYALDVSSGVETNGVKDREKILRLVKNVREANSEANK